MDDYFYVPSLKSKRGEQLALKELSTEVQSRIKPLINMIDTKDVSKFYSKKAFVDIHQNQLENATDQRIESIFESIYQGATEKSNYTSVLRYSYSPDLLIRLKPYLFNVQNGVALRIPRIQLPHLKADITTIFQTLTIDTRKIDLIIDFGCINDLAIGLVNEFASNIKNATSNLQLNNIIILSSSFPQGITMPSDKIGELPRYDWMLYSELHKVLPSIIFGDYGADDPYNPTINSRRNIVPTIRYTSENCWKIIRGHYDPAMPFDFSQFSDLSRILVKSDFYKGKEFSWGDNRIYSCANNECSYGNLETWVRIAMNHHITFVIDEF